MKFLIAFCAVFALAAADIAHHYSVVSPHVSSQYHTQDSLGQYSYGYSGGPSAKSEVKTHDGVTRGGYSYVDGAGKVQSVSYVADPVYGFRVAGTNIPKEHGVVAKMFAVNVPEVAKFKTVEVAPVVSVPTFKHSSFAVPVDTPAVAYEKARHLATVEAVKAGHVVAGGVVDTPEVAKAKAEHHVAVQLAKARSVVSPVVTYPGVYSYAAAAPVVGYSSVHHTPVSVVNTVHNPVAYSVVSSPVVSSQYQSQDALGQYSYGYVGGLSSKNEVKTADGVTRGGYSYLDSNNKVQTVNYVADTLGFRVAATNLPVATAAATPVVNSHVAAVVADTPEVVAARAAHFAAHARVKSHVFV